MLTWCSMPAACPTRTGSPICAPVGECCCDDCTRVRRWLPARAEDRRGGVSVSVGCTGGQSRSVYVNERLAQARSDDGARVLVLHRELEKGLALSVSATAILA